MTITLSYSLLKIGKARRQLEGKNDFLTMSKCYGRLNFSAISLLRAQPPKMRMVLAKRFTKVIQKCSLALQD